MRNVEVKLPSSTPAEKTATFRRCESKRDGRKHCKIAKTSRTGKCNRRTEKRLKKKKENLRRQFTLSSHEGCRSPSSNWAPNQPKERRQKKKNVTRINTGCEVAQRACVRRVERWASNPIQCPGCSGRTVVQTPFFSFSFFPESPSLHNTHQIIHGRLRSAAAGSSRATAGDLRRRRVPEGPGQRCFRAGQRHRSSHG